MSLDLDFLVDLLDLEPIEVNIFRGVSPDEDRQRVFGGQVAAQSLTAALTRRLKREVRLHCTTDPELLGGAVLRSGDLVIDGSVRGRLERIANELKES